MFTCKLCGCLSKTLRAFVIHIEFHRNVPNFNFPCGSPKCSRTFRTYSAFKSHIYRDHRREHLEFRQQQCQHTDFVMKCNVQACNTSFELLVDLLSHLRAHIDEGLDISCPFKKCKLKFHNKSSFSAHVSRKHRQWSASQLSESVMCGLQQPSNNSLNHETETCPTYEAFDFQHDDDDDGVNSQDFHNNADYQEMFLQNLALFYLKLQAKNILPASTIQDIIEQFQEIHSMSKRHMQSSLNEKLKALHPEIADSDMKELLEAMESADLLKFFNEGVLRTDHSRKTFYKDRFNHVPPESVYLGKDDSNVDKFCQYVPVQKTLESLFKQPSVTAQTNTPRQAPDEQVYHDIFDGLLYKKIMEGCPSAVPLLLYQDAFEVVNPLGSGKRKHKVLAVYMTLGNFQAHNRSSVDQMQLVLLCKEQDYKYFGPNVVFRRLIEDLKLLEDQGFSHHGADVKCRLFAIAGDNLGSHGIGGFVENFSTSEHFCRYCLINRESFHNNPENTGTPRTPESYNAVITDLPEDFAVIREGIKSDSIFNQLENFHVCSPGLPPCAGHDLFEGVVSGDLSLYIQYFVKEKKYFTYDMLNRTIDSFKYYGSDVNNKPSAVNSSGERLGGHAVQNWCLLRLLPLLIGERISNPFDDEVWLLCLQLRNIVDLICAPKISADQIAFLKVEVKDYLESRARLFPQKRLTPKHHYLLHYADLILQFGPLLRLWTLRFESKHTYFKQCARKLHNFKNVCSTLSERHQLLQAYLSAGSLFPPDVTTDRGINFHSDAYSDEIVTATSAFDFPPESTTVCNSVKYKGTEYKKGMFLPISFTNFGLDFGKIVLILVKSNFSVYFVLRRFESVMLTDMGLYHIQENSRKFQCIVAEDLIDYYPLPDYTLNGLKLIALHHGLCN